MVSRKLKILYIGLEFLFNLEEYQRVLFDFVLENFYVY